jgi:hypothetical protein
LIPVFSLPTSAVALAAGPSFPAGALGWTIANARFDHNATALEQGQATKGSRARQEIYKYKVLPSKADSHTPAGHFKTSAESFYPQEIPTVSNEPKDGDVYRRVTPLPSR